MNKGQRDRWKMFYLTEQKLFHMLNEQCQCLYSSGDDELKYSEFKNQHGTVLNKPPRFVHWIGHLKGDADEIKERAALMRNDYVRAVGEKKFTKYPSRFPVFYSNVEQINVTQHRAFSSVRVEGEYVTVKTYFDVNDIPPDMEKLRAAGFTPEVMDEVLFKSLVIRTDELYELAGADRIQARRQTGIQYRATVRRAGETRGVRSMLGLMVIDQHSNPAVVFPVPEAPRPHSLAVAGREVLLPVETPYQFFIR
ncbi:hypothetical protein [Escherichia coli]|uniref:hypothetical protein n=1 Tax=Escherichia coli TaxID=562 RepID=UPI001F5B9F42|nr:hypothetical protein [Escherichia coli]MCI3067347.1 hypothetical protein [Escherichia coli]MCI3111782.1 hypothetical protein [Escherichia coli]